MQLFLSTPSARRATHLQDQRRLADHISIHALREEGDRVSLQCSSPDRVFLSTPSARRATLRPPRCFRRHKISIHALREEGDHPLSCPDYSTADFYPRPPRGGRPARFRTNSGASSFLSTPSARRATTPDQTPCSTSENFYPRPPRGGRHIVGQGRDLDDGFLSTPSARRATVTVPAPESFKDEFLSTPSARRATEPIYPRLRLCLNFYPRPPRGGRP